MSKSIITDEAKISFKPFLHKNCGDYCLAALDKFIQQMKQENTEFNTMKYYSNLNLG
jgi:hypothetical protein